MKHVKVVLFFQNGIRKGKGMDLGAEPVYMKLWRVSHPPPSPLPRQRHLYHYNTDSSITRLLWLLDVRIKEVQLYCYSPRMGC